VATLLAALLLGAPPVFAQDDSDVGNERAALEAQYEKAFEEVFKDPGNLDKSFRFAELAIKIGNYEAAISALERMLLVNPNLPRVRLELGVLYFRLGSFRTARSYLQRVKRAPDVPAEVAARVDHFLAEVERRLKRHAFKGSIYGGARRQSNANAGPASSAVRANGVDATLNNLNTAKVDNNAFLSGQLRHTYDYQSQSGMMLESNATGYVSQQQTQGQLDLVFVDFNSGPLGKIPESWLANTNYRPYLLATYVGLEDARYMSAAGLGLDLVKVFGPRLQSDLNFEHRNKWFRNSGRRPTATFQDGSEDRLKLGSSFALTRDIAFDLSGSAAATSSDFSYNANREFNVTLGYRENFKMPKLLWPVRAAPWTMSLSGSRVLTRYYGPNPAVDPNVTRYDHEWRASLLSAAPLAKDWSLLLNLSRVWVTSKLPNYDYDNRIVSLGASWRF
jgi:tetratricopeptide (TPR) repeat protein|tara:strand:- start:433 stop:1776 length:1344 start_codon:yes stop_codon:yes gene_type:complete